MEINWFLPTGGADGRYLGTKVGGCTADITYLQQIAQAIDNLGFKGALLPTGRQCDDAWIISAALSAVTKHMKFISDCAIVLPLPVQIGANDICHCLDFH